MYFAYILRMYLKSTIGLFTVGPEHSLRKFLELHLEIKCGYVTERNIY
jgi:hypothetical protein